MTLFIPITLQGRHLGERHRFLNSLVSDAYKTSKPFETLISLPESAPIDRLFKIDLASKCRHVEYILKNLQDNDMLYVSRALKAKWLFDDTYKDIINPNYLENVLYPDMITTAINKIKHWIYLNLRDPKRCQAFYEYYCNRDINIAIKFLLKCPVETVEQECPKLFDKIAPDYFKVLCERSSLVAKMFFETLDKNESLQQKYFENKNKYLDGLKRIIKTDMELVLDILENIKWKFPPLSSMTTKFIMKKGKSRFLQKPELYAVKILHMETLAQCLNPEACEDLVLKLARAKFLEKQFPGWFTYKNVEPLIVRVDLTMRADFKKRVFVNKDIGEEVTEWPYPVYTIGSDGTDSDNDIDDNMSDVFEDNEHPLCGNNMELLECKMSKGYMKCSMSYRCDDYNRMSFKHKTLLDVLFDEYRFMSFEETLIELREKIAAESWPKNRMFMLLVLVSKTGGRIDSLRQLFQLLIAHRNEPAHVRTAVVRSLVKRTFIWRATEDIWESLMIFGEGLGLDGADSKSFCKEGLHAVMIRSLLSSGECGSAITTAFFSNFCTLTPYSLTSAEKEILGRSLVKLLLTGAKTASDVSEELYIMIYLLDTLKNYNIKVDPDFIANIKILAAKKKIAAQDILRRLYYSRIARKELIYENFDIIPTSESYMNALKHDKEILSAEVFVKLVVSEGINAGLQLNFLRKMNIYFGEKQGIRDSFLIAMKKAKIGKNYKKLARPLMYLIGDSLESFILKLDAEKSKENKLFSAQIRGHAHVARPALNLDSLEWRTLGAKYIANRVLACRQVDIDRFIKRLLMWKRTAKLATILAKRTNSETDTIVAVADVRPTVALKSGLSNIRREGDNYDPRLWELVKLLIVKVSKKSMETSRYIKRYINAVKTFPLKIRTDFVTIAFTVLKKIDVKKAEVLLYHVNLLLPNIDEQFIENVLIDYLNDEFVHEKMSDKNGDNSYAWVASLHLTILGKYLLLCNTEESQTRRFEKVGLMYLNRLESFWKLDKNKTTFLGYLNCLLKALKYTRVFMDVEYTNCIPVMGKIAEWMQGILPMDIYLNLFVDLHLTMSYFRAIRQGVKQNPEVFSDKKKRLIEGVMVVGEFFGKYVCREAHELRKRYFDSIIELYSTHMQKYLTTYFNSGRYKMEPYIIKGLLTNAEDIECYLALAMFSSYQSRGQRKDFDEILEIVKQRNDTTSQFVFHCVMRYV